MPATITKPIRNVPRAAPCAFTGSGSLDHLARRRRLQPVLYNLRTFEILPAEISIADRVRGTTRHSISLRRRTILP
jgi:hypothetical protein